jgi:hypothetical protein
LINNKTSLISTLSKLLPLQIGDPDVNNPSDNDNAAGSDLNAGAPHFNPAVSAPAALAISGGHVHLPEFWSDNSRGWFAMAEAQFIIKRVASNVGKYCHVLTALPRHSHRPAKFFVELLQSRISSFTPIHWSNSGSSSLQQLHVAKYVYIRSPPAAPALAPAYRDPYLVLEAGPKVFRVVIGGKPDTISVDRLKPHLGDSPSVASPSRRGRPPANT